MPITHATPAPGTDSGDGKLSHNAWDEAHAGVLHSQDDYPASPSAADDEFGQNAAGVPTGWTALNSPSACSTDYAVGNVRILDTAAANDHWRGIYKAIPSSSFTVTAKISDAAQFANYNACGIVLTDSTPTKFVVAGLGFNTTPVAVCEYWNSVTSKNANISGIPSGVWVAPCYVRIVVIDTTHIDVYWTRSGMVWQKRVSNYNTPFTIANVGLAVNSAGTGADGQMFVDWIRFT